MDAGLKANYESTAAIADIDAGLRSRKIGDQYEAILKVRTYLQQIPFPLFANTVLLRLAEAFHSGSNQLRSYVLKMAGECETELSKVFSHEEVARRVIKVSHSNDPVARALTLQFLGCLAPLLHDNKQVHHLISVSLDSHDDLELRSSIVALTRYARYSGDFARSVVDKVAQMVTSVATPMETKLQLVAVFRHMHSDVDTTMRVFNLCATLLQETVSDALSMAVLSSLTHLASVSPFAVPEQLHLLLSRLAVTKKRRKASIFVLRNLTVVAGSPHLWTIDQVKYLIAYELSETDGGLISAWLQCFVQLTKVPTPAVACAIRDSDLLEKLKMLSAHPNTDIRIHIIKTCLNVQSMLMAETAASLIAFLVDLFLLLLAEANNGYLNKKFFKLLSQFLRTSVDDSSLLELLVGALITAMDSVEGEQRHSISALILECLASVAECQPALYGALHDWAKRTASDGKHKNARAFQLLAVFLYPPVHGADVVADDGQAVLNLWGQDLWPLYQVGRTAMRNGHSATVALAVFQKLTAYAVTPKFRYWISALGRLCDAQESIASAEIVTVDVLDSALFHYHKASASLKAACAGSATNDVWFAERFTATLSSTAQSARATLIVVNCSALMPPPTLAITANKASEMRRRLAEQLLDCASAYRQCKDEWLQLYRRAFDADRQSLFAVELRAGLCAVCERALTLLAGHESPDSGQVSVPSDALLCVRNRGLRSLLLWARNEVDRLDAIDDLDKRFTKENIDFFLTIQNALVKSVVCFPRFFFQRLQRTEIKLQISPQPPNSQSAISVMREQQTPVKVEGVIECHRTSRASLTESRSVHKVILTTTQSLTRSTIDDRSAIDLHPAALLQQVEPINGYFEAQFLLSFPMSGTATVETQLIDKETKRQWTTDVRAQLKVNAV